MLWTIAVILLIMWLLGMVTSYTVPTGDSEQLEIMEFTRLAAILFRCLSCQLSSPLFGLPSAPASYWNWRTSPSATNSTS